MKRAGALAAAVAMVVVAAFVVRDAGTDDGDADRASGLLCPTEFDVVCAEATSWVEAAPTGAAADALIEAADAEVLGAEAWIVPAAWAHLVMAERGRLGMEPLFEIERDALASTPVTLAIWSDRIGPVTDECDESLGWQCLAETAGTTVSGDRVRVASPPVDSASGLTIAASQAAGLLARSDFAANDFDAGDFRILAERLADGQTDDPLHTMRSRGPGALTAAAVLGADARDLSSTFGPIESHSDLVPAVRADVVALVPAGSSLGDGTRTSLSAAFTAAGWDPPASGADGLPEGGALAAIRTLWNERR